MAFFGSCSSSSFESSFLSELFLLVTIIIITIVIISNIITIPPIMKNFLFFLLKKLFFSKPIESALIASPPINASLSFIFNKLITKYHYFINFIYYLLIYYL